MYRKLIFNKSLAMKFILTYFDIYLDVFFLEQFKEGEGESNIPNFVAS